MIVTAGLNPRSSYGLSSNLPQPQLDHSSSSTCIANKARASSPGPLSLLGLCSCGFCVSSYATAESSAASVQPYKSYLAAISTTHHNSSYSCCCCSGGCCSGCCCRQCWWRVLLRCSSSAFSSRRRNFTSLCGHLYELRLHLIIVLVN
jgi:hypothetical protein